MAMGEIHHYLCGYKVHGSREEQYNRVKHIENLAGEEYW
jgi:hypothetical protein